MYKVTIQEKDQHCCRCDQPLQMGEEGYFGDDGYYYCPSCTADAEKE